MHKLRHIQHHISSETFETPPETSALHDVAPADQCKRRESPNRSGRLRSSRSHVGVEFWQCLGIEQGAAVFRAENHVNNNKAKRLWHTEEYGPTARFIPAWANGPGIDTHKSRAPSARFIHSPSLVARGERSRCGKTSRAFSPCCGCRQSPGALPQAGLRTRRWR
jgi:hypothetical protein